MTGPKRADLIVLLHGVPCGICGQPAMGLRGWNSGYREIVHNDSKVRACRIGTPPDPGQALPRPRGEVPNHAPAAE